MIPVAAQAATVTNPNPNPGCNLNTAQFAPDNGQGINVPKGFKASVFKAGLNMPTGIAFLKSKNGPGFEVYVLESGHGLPSACNEQDVMTGGQFAPNNPFTPDILVFDQDGNFKRRLGKPTAPGVGFQTAGPAIDIAFENGLQGGRLFASDSNQATHAVGQNNSSRIVTVDPMSGTVKPFITGLPTGDHPTEQFAFKDNWIYWSQGSTTNSGVVGRDNGGGANQPDIPCQDIKLSDNVFDSGGGVKTSGYSPFGVQRPGAIVKAFEGANHRGVCDGAILRAPLNKSNPQENIEPFSWGYRNGYAIRFAPDNHQLKGGLLVGEDGPDERGARPSNNAPDVLSLAQQNKDGSPDYHGWPDRFGFVASSQAVFNPVGGGSDDVPVSPDDVPIRDVLAFPPQPITSPLALEAADSSFTGIDFVPKSFAVGPVQRGAALYTLEGDFGFSAPNATPPAPEVGHEVKLINFSKVGEPLELKIMNFARNATGDQAFIADTAKGQAAFNRPLNVRFGPDDCAWITDYGAVRDLGADTHFKGPPANGPLLQIPGTGVVWRICPTGQGKHNDDDD